MTWDLDWWSSRDWEVCQEKIDVLERNGSLLSPRREFLFTALDACPFDKVKVCILGQDPYPQQKFATGIAFDIPRECRSWPRTLCSVLQEYQRDLSYSLPKNGCLYRWVDQGVLLWNVCPFYSAGIRSGQTYNVCQDWPYRGLTEEILTKLNVVDQGVVFAFLGNLAYSFIDCVDQESNPVIQTSHPSPRASRFSAKPFNHSRLFSTINAKLTRLSYEPIDWRLEGSEVLNSNLQVSMEGVFNDEAGRTAQAS